MSERENERAQEVVAEQLVAGQQASPAVASCAPAALLGSAAASGVPVALSRLAHSNAAVQRVAVLTGLQAGYGNAYVQRLLRQAADGGVQPEGEAGAAGEQGAVLSVQEEFVPEEYSDLPDEHMHVAYVGPGVGGFADGGQTGIATYGEADGHDHAPHAFSDGGQTGTVVWAGGGGAGAHGNEGVGSIQAQTAPTYESRLNAATKDADAWVKPGTGTISVKRSWVGIASGDQGNGHFVTAAAASRINAHELLHVASTKRHHDANLKPLEARIADKTLGMGVSNTDAGAIAVLKTAIKWPESIKTFQDNDRADNKPMGTVDANDKGSGTYPVDAGPGAVGGTNFQHRVRLPSEPNPP